MHGQQQRTCQTLTPAQHQQDMRAVQCSSRGRVLICCCSVVACLKSEGKQTVASRTSLVTDVRFPKKVICCSANPVCKVKPHNLLISRSSNVTRRRELRPAGWLRLVLMLKVQGLEEQMITALRLLGCMSTDGV